MDDHLKELGVVAGLGAAIGVGLALGMGLRVLAAGALMGIAAGAAIGLAAVLKAREDAGAPALSAEAHPALH